MAPPEMIRPNSMRLIAGGSMLLHTAAGLKRFEYEGAFDAGPLGHLRAVVVKPGSPCAISVGQLVRAGVGRFLWESTDSGSEFLLPDGSRTTIMTESFVPLMRRTPSPDEVAPIALLPRLLSMLCMAGFVDDERVATALPGADAPHEAVPPADVPVLDAELLSEGGNEPIDPEPAPAVPIGAPADDARQVAEGAPVGGDAGLAEAVVGHNLLTHRPASPETGEACRAAKLRSNPARRVACPEKNSRVGERVHVDTIGSLLPARDGKWFVLAATDEFSGWGVAAPMVTKNSGETLATFTRTVGRENVSKICADPEREFLGRFSAYAQEVNTVIELSIPGRSRSHSRSECRHSKHENVVRVSLQQSSLPNVFWADTMAMKSERLGRVPDMDVSPHMLCDSEPSKLKLAPFGAGLRYLGDKAPDGWKLMPRSRAGLALGYRTHGSLIVRDMEVLSVQAKEESVAGGDFALSAAAAEMFELVGKPVSVRSGLARDSEPAQRAIATAVELLTSREVCAAWDTVEEWNVVRQRARCAEEEARLVRAHPILGIKGFENAPEDESGWVWKARIVGGGNNVRDTFGALAVDALPTFAPASLCEGRVADVAGALQVSGVSYQADVDGAYLVATLEGSPHFLALPKEAWPPWWVERQFRALWSSFARQSPGSSKKLRHLSKAPRTSLSSLSEVITDPEHNIRLLHVPGVDNVADILTKALPGERFRKLRYYLGVRGPLEHEYPTEHPALRFVHER